MTAVFFNDFEEIDSETLAKLKAQQVRGNQMSKTNKAILDKFIGIATGKAFAAPVPANTDGVKYAKRISTFLTTQGRKNRSVFVNKDNDKQIIVEKTEEQIPA